jgi:thiamine-phosphate pyrophosphorylase
MPTTDETSTLKTASDWMGVLRVLDAAANRAQEALRVVEDHVRFVLDDGHLTAVCKQLRHELAAALAAIPFGRRLAARETRSDVGTALETASERRREDAGSVLRANFARLEQSLRSLEEFGKVFDAGCAGRIKELRYRVYTLQRAAEITAGAAGRLARVGLYALLDGRPSPEDFGRLARAILGAGAAMIQLRDKQLGDRELLRRGRLLASLVNEAASPPGATLPSPGLGGAPRRTLWIMNDRPDLAVLASADGVHLGQEDVSVKDARRIVGPDRLVGVSTHSIEQARQAVLDGADYLGVGPTFPSSTKRFERLPGVELLRAVAAEIRLPAFAIGGISAQNLSPVRAAGFTRIAVSGAILSSGDPAGAVRELKEMMNDQ